MAQSTTEITAGGGTLYLADYGEAFPTDLTIAPAGNWDAIGYTDQGAVLDRSVTTEEARVDEILDPVIEVETGVTTTFALTVAQFTFDVLLRAMNGGTVTTDAGPPVVNTFEPPGAGDSAAFAALYVFTNQYGFNSHIQMPKVKNIAALNVTFQESGAVIRQVPLELKLLPDASLSDKPFNIVEYQSAS